MHVVVVYFQSVWHTSDVHKCYNILCHELELSRLLYDLVNLIFDQKINIILGTGIVDVGFVTNCLKNAGTQWGGKLKVRKFEIMSFSI